MYSPGPKAAFALLAVSHGIAAVWSPIQDCDETYNFWEPSHYLNHGYGLQTWEFSPTYAIRSWLYATLHSIAICIMSLLSPSVGKAGEFYSLRFALGLVSAACESRLYTALSRFMNRRIAVMFLIICSFSAGHFHATVSYLPSSFAMYMVTFATSDFMDWHTELGTSRGITWLAFGTIVGWPFVAVLAIPFVTGKLVSSWFNSTTLMSIYSIADGVARSLLILVWQVDRFAVFTLTLHQAIETIVDSFFYRKLTIVPVNIVSYNVLARSGRGPDIYGTEPWHFYIRNLLINFNLWFILACIALPLLLLHRTFGNRPASRLSFLQTLVIITPFYLWCAIFTLQPHKEERFMYPIYPCLALNAAISSHILVLGFANLSRRRPLKLIPAGLRLSFVAGIVLLGVFLGLWRAVGLATAYKAPFKVYSGLGMHPTVTGNPNSIINVCVGKEWYRFPSSYHLPANVRLRFIKSDFDGLLPGSFTEANSSRGFYPGTWLVPHGMNDRNIEDPEKYCHLDRCHFLIDSSFPGRKPNQNEPDFVNNSSSWETVECHPFLDTTQTKTVGRLFWMPSFTAIPEHWRRKWGVYCLLRKKLP